MKIVNLDDFERLVNIDMGLERVKDEKIKSPAMLEFVNDMRWLSATLRKAYQTIESLAEDKTQSVPEPIKDEEDRGPCDEREVFDELSRD